MVGHVNRQARVYEFGQEPDPALVAHVELEAEAHAGVQIGGAVGEINGTAVIRDASGNVKGEFQFGGPTTLTLDEFKEQMGLQEKQEEVDSNGGDSDNGGS